MPIQSQEANEQRPSRKRKLDEFLSSQTIDTVLKKERIRSVTREREEKDLAIKLGVVGPESPFKVDPSKVAALLSRGVQPILSLRFLRPQADL